MIDDHRHRILQAAAKVYAEHGWRGATTRRIAEEAGVNEVTIFRQFGNKEALLDSAMRESVRPTDQPSLPLVPVDPEQELINWANVNYAEIRGMRDMIRQIMTDACQRPDGMACAKVGLATALQGLRDYVIRLHRFGWISDSDGIAPADVRPAVSMLIGALFNDAMNRDMMPEFYAPSESEAMAAYVRLFLRGIGARQEPKLPPSRKARGIPSTSASTSRK